jgi:hypothetical protein
VAGQHACCDVHTGSSERDQPAARLLHSHRSHRHAASRGRQEQQRPLAVDCRAVRDHGAGNEPEQPWGLRLQPALPGAVR